MKRKVEDEDDGQEGGAKKMLMESGQGFSTAEESASLTGGSDDTTTQPLAPADPPTPPTVPTVPSVTSKTSKKRNYPSEQKIIKCTVADCPKTFNRPARLLAHLRSHNNERPYKCTYEGCDKSYTESKHLKQHVMSHTKEARYVCDTCDKAFSTGTRLRRHQKVHEGEERFRCRGHPPCSQSFRKHQTLQRHVLREHMGKKPFPCAQVGCEASYDTANALAAHKERDHGELRFWCDECCEAAKRAASAATGDDDDGVVDKKPVGFTTQFLLDQHIRHEHVNCIFCDVRFTGQYELDQHMEIYHSGLTLEDRKTVECTHPGCGKRFTKKSNMTAHHRTAHEGMRFVCGRVDTRGAGAVSNAGGGGGHSGLLLDAWDWAEEGCGEGFVDKAKLVQHVLFVHLGVPRPETGPGASYPNQSVPPPASSSSFSSDPPPPGVGSVDFLNEISGVAHQERRQIACAVPGCSARFIRYADLQSHTRADHPEHAPEQRPPFDAAQEEANMMQLVNWDAVIDPNLFLHF
ncbi:hypothetical protein VPNG_07442 [Cytospora leucostoma]|uniref:C2H2-type domain-containing protein n=1 Tax=Cytospora leucostoma TaxID=1230097 RepID=A0A423WMK6_9PEZI|nr:hypothetical protein VPNG_07442 [Cytospora leucostoma]